MEFSLQHDQLIKSEERLLRKSLSKHNVELLRTKLLVEVPAFHHIHLLCSVTKLVLNIHKNYYFIFPHLFSPYHI